uniref:Putative RNA-dependent RNA polymerase n=1 Tax=Heterobasidion partitivirus 1 TaxID=942041 RepID=E7E1F5_9VIRU|nr:putative RNA-dependent RNA polymerase [Heterobasidion partitivirus 1]
MEYLTSLFSRVLSILPSKTNFEYVAQADFRPSLPQVNQVAIDNHKATLLRAFDIYLTSEETDTIVNGYKRTTIDPDTILDDFFSGDIDPHPEPTDLKSQLAIETGLNCMFDAFKPPQPARPTHLYDVQHKYPYKWQVNAEAPFSTHKYFLDMRQKFEDFYDRASRTWSKYVNPLDALARYGPDPPSDTLSQVTPPKFGFMKGIIFSFVHSWLHVVKSRFRDNAGYENSNFYRQRFIFPMQLHVKTAVVLTSAANKIRSIWGVSKAWIIAETQIYWEYIAWAKLNRGATPLLWGYETFTGGWHRLYSELFTATPSTYLTIDWSRFDKRAHFWLLRKIFFKIRFFFDFTAYVQTHRYPTNVSVNPDKIQALWEWTLENFFDAPIVLTDGSMYKRRFAGIPSGLFITQLVDSWYNYTMLAAILAYLGYDPKLCIIKVQGDDSIIRLNVLIPSHEHDIFMQDFQDAATHLFGSIVSIEKSEISNTLQNREVLSYRNINGLPYRNLTKMLAQYYHTKALNPTPEITMAQAIGFAFAACGNDYRIHCLLKEIYDYYKDQGFTASRAGLTIVFGDSPDLPYLDMPLDEFPTQQDVQRFFLSFDYKNEVNDEKTWPSDQFLFAPCSRPL